jgi:hypothetical protein
MDELACETAIFDVLDRIVEDDLDRARNSLIWLLLPDASGVDNREYLSTASARSILLSRLVLRYPLMWFMYHFRSPDAETKARSLVGAFYDVAGNEGCPTYDRVTLALRWFFSFGDVSRDALTMFQNGLRQWFDPIGFRGAMLELFKIPSDKKSPAEYGFAPVTVRQSRRVFLSAVVEEEPSFALCSAYAAYRAGMGAFTVTSSALFGDSLARIVSACSAPPDSLDKPSVDTPHQAHMEREDSNFDPLRECGSVVILRDIDLQLSDAVGEPHFESLNAWPPPLPAVLSEKRGVTVRVVSATTDRVSRTPPKSWPSESKRLGWDYAGKYVGLNKPLDSLLLAEGHGLETVPFYQKLVSATQGRREIVAGRRSSHSAPRHLQEDLQLLDRVSSRLAESDKIDDIIYASLLQLIRFEALRGAGPLLIAECLEKIYQLEIRVEIISPYFRDQSALRPRLDELKRCSDDIGQNKSGITVHLTRQVLGKLKVIYQEYGVFGAADQVQFELLRRPAFKLAARFHYLWGWTLRAFFNPFRCLLYWLSANVGLWFLAKSCHALSPDGSKFPAQFIYLALSANLDADISPSWCSNIVVIVNVLMLAVFTTSLFRWVTRD